MIKATWKKGKKTVTGSYEYYWASDRFFVILDAKDSVTGRQKTFWTNDDNVSFNGWKKVENE